MPRRSEHFVRFYHDDGPLVLDIACYLSNAVEHGGALIIATAQRIAAVRRELGALVPHAAHRLVALDAETTLAGFMVDGWPDRARFDAVVGTLVRDATGRHDSVRAYGEMVALLCADGLYDAAVALEELWNELAQTCTFSLFCAYKWSLFPSAGQAESFRQICDRHDHCGGHVHEPQHEPEPGYHCPELQRPDGALDPARLATLAHVDFAHFLDSTAEGIRSIGPDGTILWANKAELDMLGYRWAEYVGRPVAQFHADQDFVAAMLARLLRGETIHDQPARLRCKDGTVRHVLIRSSGHFVDGQLRFTRCFTREAPEAA
jgi:PAS domain S-box-containing protein